MTGTTLLAVPLQNYSECSAGLQLFLSLCVFSFPPINWKREDGNFLFGPKI